MNIKKCSKLIFLGSIICSIVTMDARNIGSLLLKSLSGTIAVAVCFKEYKKQSPKDKIVVYHSIGDTYRATDTSNLIASVKKHGLLSRKELFKQGLTKVNPDTIFESLPNQHNVIYFRPYLKAPSSLQNTVGYLVDPTKTYVYNQEYRADRKKSQYNSSKVRLDTYLSNCRLAETMRNNAPQGKVVIFNPKTSEPFYVESTDERYSSADSEKIVDSVGNKADHYLYLAEVTIPQSKIHPKDLIFFKSSHNNFIPAYAERLIIQFPE